ncbi:hypothetical protein ACLOAV_001338 [Pseudogymnoascus australis]
MFDFMQHVSLCGYSAWPNRIMITIDLKNRRIVKIWRYSTYGNELPIYQQSFIDTAEQALASKADEDVLAPLQALLTERDDIFHIPKRRIDTAPGNPRMASPSG